MFYPLGDSALTVKLGQEINLSTHYRVKLLFEALQANPLLGMIELVPSYTTLTVYYDPLALTDRTDRAHSANRAHGASRAHSANRAQSVYGDVCAMLRQRMKALGLIDVDGDVSENTAVDLEQMEQNEKVIDIPICYAATYAPDLAFVAAHNGLEEAEVCRIHASAQYVVSMLGFLPGFPYLGGMSTRIATPRKTTPTAIAPGSVGIAGAQTGIYPISSPGGWQIIGRTPLKLFDPTRAEPFLLQFGDRVRFYPISKERYENWEAGVR